METNYITKITESAIIISLSHSYLITQVSHPYPASMKLSIQEASYSFHSGVSVTGIFNDLAAVAFLPPPHSTFAALRMAAVSPTAKSVKILSDSANIV